MISIHSFSNTKNPNDFLESFSTLPRKLNKDHERTLPPGQYWILLFSKMTNLTKELFIAEIDGQLVGRISCNLYNPDKSKGFIGCLEYDLSHPEKNNIISKLIKTAESWLQDRNVKEVLGPIDFSIWFGYRLKSVETTHTFRWEPHAPLQYFNDLQELGFQKDMGYLSALYNDFYPLHKYTQKHYQKAIDGGYYFTKVDTQSDFEIRNVLEMNLSSFTKSYLYDEVTEDQFNSVFINFIKTENAKYVFLMKNPDGEDLGMIYSFEDQKFLVIKTILVLPAARKSNLGNALIHYCLDQAKKDGLQKFIGAMVREDNNSLQFLTHLDSLIETHRYHLLKKSL